MHVEQLDHHSTLREGLVTGLLGALILAAWYFGSDAVQGRLLYTPNVLGQLFLQADSTPTGRAIETGAVAGYTALHFAAFTVFGVILAWAIHLAIRHPSWRSGIIIGLVTGLGVLYTFLFMAPPFAYDPSLRWSVIIGSLVSALAMWIYLWRRHSSLRGTLQETEAPGPPHPPGGPNV